MLAKIKNYQNKVVSGARQLRDLRVVGLLVFLVIALMVSWSGVKAIEANYDLQKQIAALEAENKNKKLSNENMRLTNEYFETPQYLDIAARQNFGLAAPGEVVLNVPRSVALAHTVDLPKLEQPHQESQPDQSRFERNFQAWLDFLLHRQTD
jgi:cell division protein FtsB